MNEKSNNRDTEDPRISVEARPTVISYSRSPIRLVGGVIITLTLVIAVAFFVLNGDQIIQRTPKNDRQHVATMSRVAANAVQTLNQEPCHRTAIIQLILAYKKAQKTRAIVNEINRFEQLCAPLPEARYDHIQALLVLSEFKAALPIANTFVVENPAAPDAWATRAKVEEHLGDLESASHDLRQALALFPDPSRVVASSWYRLTEVLSRRGRFCEAVTPLQTFVSFDPAKRRTQQILTLLADLRLKGNCIQSGKVREEKLRFPPGALALVVDAKINGVTGRFVVDTGASNVALTHEYANRAGLSAKDSRVLTINTANGPIKAKTSYADTITLGSLTARQVFVNILPPSEHGFGGEIDGLLGLSFLGNFDFSLRNGILVLATPKG